MSQWKYRGLQIVGGLILAVGMLVSLYGGYLALMLFSSGADCNPCGSSSYFPVAVSLSGGLALIAIGSFMLSRVHVP
jgi:hypothetical protein